MQDNPESGAPISYSDIGDLAEQARPTPLPTVPVTYDAHGNTQFKRLRLDPDLADGHNWTIHDVPDEVLLQTIRGWMENAMSGDEFTIGLVVMSDEEADALPEI